MTEHKHTPESDRRLVDAAESKAQARDDNLTDREVVFEKLRNPYLTHWEREALLAHQRELMRELPGSDKKRGSDGVLYEDPGPLTREVQALLDAIDRELEALHPHQQKQKLALCDQKVALRAGLKKG